MQTQSRQRLPQWLRRGVIECDSTKIVRDILKENNLNTVCDSARCPNKAECFSKKTATFMIMGKNCTRGCRFCAVNHTKPEPLDENEPLNIALAVQKLSLLYAVITSVTRDDLPDGGAEHFLKTIIKVNELNPDVKIEVLTPDFKGDTTSIDTVINSPLSVFNHNLETTKRLHKTIRPQAGYERSLEVLRYVKQTRPDLKTKTGLMVGLGETFDELEEIFKDLKSINCDIVTIGQYIQPSKNNVEVVRYVEPQEFEELEKLAKSIGIKYTFFAPLARSSYRAKEVFE
ncbi:MAG: lipoyl synthase [Candidatus Gastranaerophilales bacterium]|nr:lipoyl synthase [Candidatus Gastranaerophilales bacterium]